MTVRFGAPGGDLEKARQILSREAKVARVEGVPGAPAALRLYPRDGLAIALTISEAMRRENLPVEQIQVEAGRLDEVFRNVTTKGKTKVGASAATVAGKGELQ